MHHIAEVAGEGWADDFVAGTLVERRQHDAAAAVTALGGEIA